MSAEPPREIKRLPEPGTPRADMATAAERVTAVAPSRQLSELPKDELEHLAEEFGLDATRYQDRQDLVAAIHGRRQLIASFDRDAMLDVVRWGRRPVMMNASNEQLSLEIARIRSMKFSGLSSRGLVVLGRLRGIEAREDEPVPDLIRKLRKQEGFFARMNRKRRSILASFVANIVGGKESSSAPRFLPPGNSNVHAAAQATMKEEIEEAGLFGGISNRLKKTADSYINQKLDEIEARIDRKLDEIDRRLAEWRDKEVANRLKILKITLWASVIVGVVSLIYSYVVVNLYPNAKAVLPIPERPRVQQPAPVTQP